MTDTPDGDDAADVRLPTDESLFLQRARAVLEEAPVDAGPYRVIERIGGGGMGEVYKAQEGELGRLVALKLIRTGHDSAALSERFQVERRLLAEVDHPHVARVFGGGTTEDGRLYLAMEFVDGLPITEFADAQRLTIPQRLHLFRQVCEAIAYVHSKGIIHRDVKPANVLAYLFDGKPFAKVIDFGVAQAPARSFAAGVTVLGLPVGTIGYMSPEQASGKGRVDTRSDVYGLGALLYELLTGVPPFDVERLANAAIGEVLTLIQTNDPPRPSTRLSELDTVAAKESGLTIEPGVAPTARIAAARRTGARELRHTLSRELELIPLHAMRREPERRYATVVELAADVDRYLSGDALLAGP